MRKLARTRVVAAPLRLIEFGLGAIELFLHLLHRAELLLLVLPALGE